MVTIIFTHPWHGSFNKAILDTITAKLDKENRAYQVIDLPKDNFNPTLSESELAVYSRGEALDPLVSKYQGMLSASDEVVFIFPIWWGTMPAILKGFFDKVLLVNFSHNYNNGWTPLLKISKTSIITTSESPTVNFKSSIEDNFIGSMLYPVGFANATWLNCESTSHGSSDNRKEFLNRVGELI